MSGRTIERQQSIEQTLANEETILRDIRLLREEQEKEGLNERVLYFEESGGIKIVSYNEYEKEIVTRDPEGKEQIEQEQITIDEKNELDSMLDFIEEHGQDDVNGDDIEFPEFVGEEWDDRFERFEEPDNDRDDDMEYDS